MGTTESIEPGHLLIPARERKREKRERELSQSTIRRAPCRDPKRQVDCMWFFYLSYHGYSVPGILAPDSPITTSSVDEDITFGDGSRDIDPTSIGITRAARYPSAELIFSPSLTLSSWSVWVDSIHVE